MFAGERKNISSLFASKWIRLQVECWQTVDGILFQLVNGTGVFFGVLQTAMAEKAGNGLDIGTIVEDVNSEGMAAHVPTDVFFSSEKIQKVLILGG